MFSLLGKMFGSEKALTGIVDGAVGAIDALHYSEEEKAANKAKVFDQVIQWQQATQGQNLARRVIALSCVFVWLLSYIAALALNVVAVWVEEGRLTQSAELLQASASDMDGVIMLIMAFYFSARNIDKIADVALSRFKK
jgi:hypothetical protein